LRLLPRRRWLRRLVVWGGAATLTVTVVVVAVGAWLYTRADINTVGDLDFANPLTIPPLLEPDTDSQGRKVFDLDLQQGTSELIPGRTSETRGANGSYLGPTLRASRGDEVQLNVHNGLPEDTTIHWHGMHLPADADGNPHQPIAPGDTWSPSWRIDQPAATLWYHPHPHGRTAITSTGAWPACSSSTTPTRRAGCPRTTASTTSPSSSRTRAWATTGTWR
jgi:FtsP/CotA-like multicopper oxidase with cupredoxin domain